MKLRMSLCVLAAGCSLLCGCKAADTSAADAKAISDTETQWNQDLAAKDVARIAAHYADDGVLLIAGEPAIVGRVEILKMFQTTSPDPTFSLKFHANKIEVAKSGELGFVEGDYTLQMTDPVSRQLMHDHGSYVTTYRKQADGSWKAEDDVSSSAGSPALPAK